MAAKVVINNISGSAVFYKESDPREVFVEVKDNGYPVAAFRNHICFIGGNWIGERAKEDDGPRDTCVREIFEELSFERPTQTSAEMQLMGFTDKATSYQAIPAERIPEKRDREELHELKMIVKDRAVHLFDKIDHVPKCVFDRAEPENQRKDHHGLNSFFAVPLANREWAMLRRLQVKFGNISNESFTFMTDLETILEKQLRFSWGYDRSMQRFFLRHDLVAAKGMYLVPDIEVEFLNEHFETYQQYLERYDVLKRP